MNKDKEMLYACSKCFTRHPFEELSQGQQLCKKCRGDFPVVKCTYCRSEFQQENKNKTSSICKRCEQCVAQYGKPTSCQFCQLPAAFVGGKCQRCSSYFKRYGPPKTCEQCKQKSAFDKGDDVKLMCWACSCSYKRALAKTKQSDPARHSRVFKKEKRPEEGDKHRKREKYMNSKKPNRPDVTKMEAEQHAQIKTVSGKKEPVRDNDTDHVGEITQLKEKIVFLEKTIKQKENQLISKDQEITQMKAKLFNEEKLIREKMKKMSSVHDEKVSDLNNKIRALNNEISKLRKDARPVNRGKRMDNLFKDSKKKAVSRTASPTTRSRSRSPVRSKSKSPVRSTSASPARSVRSSPSRSPSPSSRPAKVAKLDPSANETATEATESTANSGNAGESEVEKQTSGVTEEQSEENQRNSRSPSPAAPAQEKSKSPRSRSQSKSPTRNAGSRSASSSP